MRKCLTWAADVSSASAATGDDRAKRPEALVALGYSRSEAVKAVSKVYVPDMDVQKILSAALRELKQDLTENGYGKTNYNNCRYRK